jgi:hypothetical protein
MIAINFNHCLSMARTMRNGLLRFAAQALVSASLAAQPAAGTSPLHMEPELEIALARSACPPSMAGTAVDINCRTLIVRTAQQYRAPSQE